MKEVAEIQKKYYLALDYYEHGILHDERNARIGSSQHTDAVDELIINIVEETEKEF